MAKTTAQSRFPEPHHQDLVTRHLLRGSYGTKEREREPDRQTDRDRAIYDTNIPEEEKQKDLAD